MNCIVGPGIPFCVGHMRKVIGSIITREMRRALIGALVRIKPYHQLRVQCFVSVLRNNSFINKDTPLYQLNLFYNKNPNRVNGIFVLKVLVFLVVIIVIIVIILFSIGIGHVSCRYLVGCGHNHFFDRFRGYGQ